MSTRRKEHLKPIITIDHEGLQRISSLGAIDPDTGLRYYWSPDAAVVWLNALMDDVSFTPSRYCHRCEAYDFTLGIFPEDKWLPNKGRREVAIENPVNLPWRPGKSAGKDKLQMWHKSRPGRPAKADACHMCLVSYLDEEDPPELSSEEKVALKSEWMAAREEVARLNRAAANANPEQLAEYIERRLQAAQRRLRRAALACRDNGVRVTRPRTQRAGDEPPEN